MDWLRLLLRLSLRRARSSTGLLVLIAIVVFATVTLVGVSAVYSQTLAEAGLRHTLASIGESSLQMRIVVRDRPTGRTDYQRLRDTVESAVAQRVAWLEDYQHRYGRTQSIPLGIPQDDGLQVTGDMALLFFQTGYREKVRLVEGDWPEMPASQGGAEALELEVLVGDSIARRMRWQVGSTAVLFPYGTSSEERVNVRIAGIMEPEDPGDLYWLGDLSHFDAMSEGSQALVPFFLPEESYFDSLGAAYPTLMGTYWWFVFLRIDELTASEVDGAEQEIASLETDINKSLPRSLVLTGLKSTLEEFEQRLTLSRVPLMLLTSLVVGVLLYFLVLMMNLLVRSRSREMALIRGRGAGVLQAAALLALGEGLGMVAVSVALGPVVAWAIVRGFLVRSLAPAGVTDPSSLVGLSYGVFVLAACIGLAALGILFVASIYSARLHLADFLRERARPPGTPLVHRYYLDLLVLVALGVLLWQVHIRGGFVSERLLGGLQVDPSLLFGPAIALLAAGLVLLRALPAVLRGLSALSERAFPAWVSFTLKRMARDPVAYGLLATILVAAAALGTFASALHSTLLRSDYEQVYYSTASDIVVKEPLGRPGEMEMVDRIGSIPGVEAVTAVDRDTVRLAKEGEEPLVTVLAVTPETLAETAWFRPDFADGGISQLAGLMQAGPVEQGDELWLPAEAESLSVWCRLQEYTAMYMWKPNLWARVVDSQGHYENILLGEMSQWYKWLYMEAPLPEPGPGRSPPFRLVSIYFGTTDVSNRSSGVLDLDEITAKMPDSTEVLVEGFEEARPWRSLPVRKEEATVAWQAEAAHSGALGMRYSWKQRSDDSPTGLILTSTPTELNAIGGPGFVPGEKLFLHPQRYLVPVTVQEVVRYFPTLDPAGEDFLLVNLEEYSHYMEEQSGYGWAAPNEFWVSLTPEANMGEVLPMIGEEASSGSTLVNRDSLLDWVDRNPLRAGSWWGVTVLAVIVLIGVVLLGLVTYGSLFFEGARVDLAVARTFGFHRRHVALCMFLECALLVALGAVAGWGVGLGLTRWVLTYLAVGPGGDAVLPPMLLTWSGGLLAVVFGSIVGATLVSLVLSGVQAASLRMADVLRHEE